MPSKRGVPYLPITAALAVACSQGGPAGFASSTAAPQPGQHVAVPTDASEHPPEHGRSTPEHRESPLPSHGPHWGYTGAEGPDSWATLSAEYRVCGDGVRQSPIDLTAADARSIEPIEFHYQPTTLGIVNNGHTVQVNYYGDGYVELRSGAFRLRQFHFHAPSEHTIDGRHADMEWHFVHQSEDGRLAVVGVMVNEGE